jgi:hypothetical protein
VSAPHSHPAYEHLLRLYGVALADWERSAAIRRAAEEMGMDERAYCDARLVTEQFAYASTSTTPDLTREHFDAAYTAARVLARKETT